jgi:hypothetical protein
MEFSPMTKIYDDSAAAQVNAPHERERRSPEIAAIKVKLGSFSKDELIEELIGALTSVAELAAPPARPLTKEKTNLQKMQIALADEIEAPTLPGCMQDLLFDRVERGLIVAALRLAAQADEADAPGGTIDSVPSCGQENDYRCAQSQTPRITEEMVRAAIEAAWPGPEIIYDDHFDCAEAMMRAALEAALTQSDE